MLLNLVICATLAFVVEGRSPHADYVEELVKSNAFGSRISDNILEDAILDLRDLVKKYKYPFEEHSVTTHDGYILEIHRIPHGRDQNNKNPGNKPVVFLMHGLLSSSADYITMGPGSALAYILAEAGFDVWMGNARGNYFSRKHRRLNPNSRLNIAFWRFSWDEIGNHDLPTMIDYVLHNTGKTALHYIGFSQGTTSFFVMASLRPDYNKKIISMHAMAPVAYMAHNSNPLFRLLAPRAKQIEALATLIGVGEFMPNTNLLTKMGIKFCNDKAITQRICSQIMFMVGGRNELQHNATMLPVKLGHTPAGAAVRQFVHYGQGIVGQEFRRFDHGFIKNILEYGRISAPHYDLSKISAPVFLHYSERDPFAHVNDVDRLFDELGNPMGKFRVNDKSFSHLDFIWGINAKSLLYDRIIGFMRTMDRPY